jgi:hypothetical protein
MAGKEAPEKIDEYSNNKGYTREQIDDFNTDRAVTKFLAIAREDRAEWHQSGTLLFSERQKKQAQREQRMREENPDLDKILEAWEKLRKKIHNRVYEWQPKTPPEPEMLFDRIHKGKYVYISKEGKTRTKKIVFPAV